MLATRRPHQKSRKGCVTCKQKKIKCDEAKPSCKYCTLRSRECVYSHPDTGSSLTPPSAVSTPTAIATSSVTTTACSSLLPASSPGPGCTSSDSNPNLDPTLSLPAHQPCDQWSLSDMELLYFYASSTSLTLSNVPENCHVWQYVVPQIAFSHIFLLHELLALAALHKSKVSPERRDVLGAIAAHHHATALPMFRAGLEKVDSSNCHAYSAFGSIITIYELASAEHADIFFRNVNDLSYPSSIEWLQLLKGAGNLVRDYYPEVSNGPLKPIYSGDDVAEDRAAANPSENSRFSALKQLWDGNEFSMGAAEVESLKEALRSVQIYYTMLTASDNNSDAASTTIAWIVQVSDVYLEMVRAKQPAALIVLAHFCLLLNRVEDFWWIRGTSRALLQSINQALGKEWEAWISWPLQDLVLSEFKKGTGRSDLHS